MTHKETVQRIHSQYNDIYVLATMERENLNLFPEALRQGEGYTKAEAAVYQLEQAATCLREAERFYRAAGM